FAVVLLGAEVAGGLEARPVGPAAVAVPLGGGARGVELGEFLGAGRAQVGVGADFFGPVGVHELAVFVDEGEVGVVGLGVRRVGLADEAQIGEAEGGEVL